MLFPFGYIPRYGEAGGNGLKIHSVTSSYLVYTTSIKYTVLDLKHIDHYNAMKVQASGQGFTIRVDLYCYPKGFVPNASTTCKLLISINMNQVQAPRIKTIVKFANDPH